ncbi:MAG: S-layer homology domain-containing protein [Thermostichales cyanobacterium HHBFW_bins_127]
MKRCVSLLLSGWLMVIPGWAAAQPAIAQVATSQDWTTLYTQALAQQGFNVASQVPFSATLTRGEFAQWLTRFFEYRYDRSRSQPIQDVPATSPDHDAIQAVLQAGVMRLFENGEFRPAGNLTKLEALAILVRVLQLPPPTQADVDRWMALYSDANDVPAVGRPFIAMAGQANLIVNIPDPRRLEPNQVLNRGTGAVLIHQALAHQGKVTPIPPPVAQLTPAPPVAATPTITAIRLQPESGTLNPGSLLTIEVQGTAGAQVQADLDGRIPLTLAEMQPGIYRGSYSVSSADNLRDPEVRVQLTTPAGSTTQVRRRFPQLVLGTSSSLPPPLPPALPPVTSSNPNPLFTGIRIRPERGELKAGDILTINIWGVRGGVAQFDIGSLARNQPMREISPHLYEGTYVVAETHQETNPRLSVILTANGRSDQYQQLLPLRIDGSQGTVPPPALPISSTPLPLAPRITRITSDSSNRILRTNDILTVTLEGDPGGQASFRIVNLTPDVFMTEVRPGFYEGRVSIAPGTPPISNGVLIFSLERNGQRTSQQFRDPITISP